MLGFNGGLLGVRKVPTTGNATGLWMPNEQSVARRAGIWPLTGAYYLYLTVVDATTGGTGMWLGSGYDNPQNAFDGNPSTYVACNNGSYIKFTPGASISFQTSLEIGDNMENGLDSVTLYTPSGSITRVAGGNGANGKVVFDGPDTLLYLTVQDRPPLYFVCGFSYIKVDGVELVDPT